jgi:hypothetical protein
VTTGNGHIVQMLNESAKAVREEIKSKVESGKLMALRYGHPGQNSRTRHLMSLNAEKLNRKSPARAADFNSQRAPSESNRR